ncbi:M56 family metallopeptidase [Flavonifractor sp. AGMB03687]|uniref:M56 family metallopeptidase n=1 Tax=Flavonifractor sp. AGMB03687 TaxID=2785133 RepID=UPI001ADFD871|nr:M56 family metallopeptidase [Flavonifractor sp. AGMB03687]
MTSFDVGLSLFFGAVIALLFLLRWWYERKIALSGSPDPEAFSIYQSALSQYSPKFFPIFILSFILMRAIFSGWDMAAGLLLELSLQLLVLLPLLRRRISALACATLWLLPTLLYFPFFPGILSLSTTSYRPSLLVLSVPRDVLLLLVKLWGVGAAVVLAWQIFSHYRFCRAILKDAVPVTDPEVLSLWNHAQSILRRKKPIPLLISPAVASPLTVGLYSMVALLPQRDFTLEQYRLIFRHELLHIQRSDVDMKCFCMLCRAICWFNPLVWVATRRASDDLELSCDELVVYGAEESVRQTYAALLLETAGDQRGLSTCLSASASSLRQRLRGVMAPGKRTSGAVLLGLTMALLMLCFGMVTVGMAGSGQDLVLTPYGAEQAVAATLVADEQRFYLTLRCSDGSQLEVRWDDQFCVARRDHRDLALFRMDRPVNWDYLRTLAA